MVAVVIGVVLGILVGALMLVAVFVFRQRCVCFHIARRYCPVHCAALFLENKSKITRIEAFGESKSSAKAAGPACGLIDNSALPT